MRKYRGWNAFFDIWKKLNRPIRPLGETLRIYKELLNKIKIRKPKILVWGATPELRDLALSKSSKVTSVDISEYALHKFREMMRNKKRSEKLIAENWLRIGGEFDIVLGDISLSSLVFPAQYDRMLKKANKMLKNSKGYLIIRQWVYKRISEKTVRTSRLSLSELIMLLETVDASNKPIYRSKAEYVYSFYLRNKKKIENRYGKIGTYIFELYKDNPMEWSIPPKRMFEQVLKKYFALTERRYAGDHALGSITPIYLCKTTQT